MVGIEPSLGVRDQDTLSTIWFRHTSPGLWGGRRRQFKRSSVTCYSDSLADVPTKNENVVVVYGMPDLIYNIILLGLPVLICTYGVMSFSMVTKRLITS